MGIELTQVNPAIQITAPDLPDVLRSIRRTVEQSKFGRPVLVPCRGHAHHELAESAYDLIILSNVCHLFDPDVNRTLLRRLRPALRPNPTLAIMDALPAEGPVQRWHLCLCAPGLRLRTTAGQAYPLSSYSDWTRAARYGRLSAASLYAQPSLTLLTCTVR